MKKPFAVGLEDELLEWIHERRTTGLQVSRAMIPHKAQAIHEQKCKAWQVSPSFILSNGWVQKFMARNRLSEKCRTELQKDQDRLIDKLIAYILQVQRQQNRHYYSHSDIIAMDQTAVRQYMLSSTTVDNVGGKSILLKTAGHESLRLFDSKGRRNKTKAVYCLSGSQERNKAA